MGYIPASMPSDGTLKVAFVPAFTGKLTELKAASAKELSCYLTAFAPGTDEATVTDSRLCSKQDFEQPGKVTESLEVTYVFNTIVPDDDVARTTLKQGVIGFLVLRWGLDVDDEWAVGQEVDYYPIRAGVQRKMAPEANSVHKIGQKTFVRGEVERDLKLAA
jgi:hypothetical protein